MIHIGNLLHTYFENKRIRRAALARKMDIHLINLMKMEKKESLQIARLWEISTHLKHNFFMDIAQSMPQTYTNTQNIFEQKDQEIAHLQKQIEHLTIERDLLMRVRG